MSPEALVRQAILTWAIQMVLQKVWVEIYQVLCLVIKHYILQELI